MIMKKLKINNFISKHPKLKKVGVILSVVFAIWGVVLTIILIIGLALNNVKDSERKLNVIAYGDYKPLIVNNINEKPKQSVLDYNGYNYILSINDLINSYTWANFYNTKTAEFNAVAINSSVEFYFGEIPSCSVVDWAHVDWDICKPNRSNFDFNCIRFTCTRIGSDQVDQSYHIYNVIVVNKNTNQTLSLCTMVHYLTYGSGSIAVLYNNFTSGNGYYFSKMDCPLLTGLVLADTDNGYGNGYQAGYTSGSSSGYINGYTDGYDQALEDTGGLTNNPFQLIANAFEGVASILDINVLPHLKLGVILLTPLIVSIIIVVVKLIRG